ncbi:MAG: hypothetical protein MJZ51_02085, partial [Bacteroidales bacterium]|nr:hypothetical protein [Bacteroidales bacterium]
MIPKIIHYCWFGRGELPQLVRDCMASWHHYMPDWEYRLWNEESFVRFAQSTAISQQNIITHLSKPADQSGVNHRPSIIDEPSQYFEVEGQQSITFEEVLKSMSVYAYEAYLAKKYAFVSDYVRLWALEKYGGLYMDVDFEVYKPFDNLLKYDAFAGFEGSKHLPVMMGVCASIPHGEWISEQLKSYEGRHFVKPDGSFDMTTNVQFITANMAQNGFLQNGLEQDYKDLHVFPVDYFSPRHTTGEYIRTDNTYCEHKGLGSWSENNKGWKLKLRSLIGQKNMTRL